ncbi:MAG: hypothetical protein Q8R24_09100 [Legionellaceae bacterium]|nr:hypothetical protein [Legionellaceae bacterium]
MQGVMDKHGITVETQTDITFLDSEEQLRIIGPSELKGPLDHLSSILNELRDNPKVNVRRLFNNTYDIFCQIKSENNIMSEIKLCLEISELCQEKLKGNDNLHSIFQRSMTMYRQLLRIRGNRPDDERKALTQFLRVHDQYNDTESTHNQEHLLDLLDESESDVPDRKMSSTQGTQTFFGASSPSLSVDHKQSIRIDFHQLIEHLIGLESNHPHSAGAHQEFSDLYQAMWTYVHQLMKQYPKSGEYSLSHEVIEGFALAVRIQLAHIEHLKASKAPVIKNSKALQGAAQLLRLYNEYYQRSDASIELKAQFSDNVRSMQEKSLHFRQFLACQDILACSSVTQAEKNRARDKSNKYKQLSASDLFSLFQEHYPIAPSIFVGSVVFEYDTLSPQEISRRLHHRLAICSSNLDELNLLYHDAIIFLSKELNRLIPQSDYCALLVHYADADVLMEPIDGMNWDRLTDVCAHTQDKFHLLRAFELYYKIKIKHLNASADSISTDDHLRYEYITFLRFSSNYRQDVYRFLLLDDARLSEDIIRLNCDQILAESDYTSVLINQLVRIKLSKLSPKRDTEQKESTFTSDQDIDPSSDQIPSVPHKSADILSSKSVVSKSLKATKEEQQTIWATLTKQYSSQQLLPGAPGWLRCKRKMSDHLVRKEYNIAQQVLETWIQHVEQLKRASDLFKITLFEAKLCLLIVFRLQDDYVVALEKLNELSTLRIVPTQYETIAYHQQQTILCERGHIYLALHERLSQETINYRVLACEQFEEAKRLAAEHDKLCFPALWLEIKDIDLQHDTLTHYDGLITYLEKIQPLSIDEYSLPYMHLVYRTLAQAFFKQGIVELKAMKANEALGISEVAGAHLTAFIEQSIKIYTLLLVCGMSQYPEQEGAIHLELATLYHQLYMIENKKGYFDEANKHYQSVMKHTQQPDDPKIKQAEQCLSLLNRLRALGSNCDRVGNLVMEQESEKQHSRFNQSNDFIVGRFNAQSQSMTHQDACIRNAKAHTALTHIKNIICLFYAGDVLKNQKLKEARYAFSCEIVDEKGCLGALTKLHYNYATAQYLETLAVTDDSNISRVLYQWHAFAVECHAKMNDAFSNQNAEKCAGILWEISPTIQDDMIELRQRINSLEEQIRKRADSETMIVEQTVWSMPRPMEISAELLQHCFSDHKNRIQFKLCHRYFQEHRYWEAYILLMNFEKNGTQAQKKIGHFWVGKLLLWLLDTMLSDDFIIIRQRDVVKPIFETIFNEIKAKCKSKLNQARDSDVIQLSYIEAELNKLKTLPDMASIKESSLFSRKTGGASNPDELDENSAKIVMS